MATVPPQHPLPPSPPFPPPNQLELCSFPDRVLWVRETVSIPARGHALEGCHRQSLGSWPQEALASPWPAGLLESSQYSLLPLTEPSWWSLLQSLSAIVVPFFSSCCAVPVDVGWENGAFSVSFVCLFWVVLGIKLRISGMLGRHCTTQLRFCPR